MKLIKGKGSLQTDNGSEAEQKLTQSNGGVWGVVVSQSQQKVFYQN